MLLDVRVQSSLERKTSKFVLSAVSDFLDRNFNSEPRYRKPGALKFDRIGLKFREPNSVENLLLEGLTAYRSQLITQNLN